MLLIFSFSYCFDSSGMVSLGAFITKNLFIYSCFIFAKLLHMRKREILHLQKFWTYKNFSTCKKESWSPELSLTNHRNQTTHYSAKKRLWDNWEPKHKREGYWTNWLFLPITHLSKRPPPPFCLAVHISLYVFLKEYMRRFLEEKMLGLYYFCS